MKQILGLAELLKHRRPLNTGLEGGGGDGGSHCELLTGIRRSRRTWVREVIVGNGIRRTAERRAESKSTHNHTDARAQDFSPYSIKGAADR